MAETTGIEWCDATFNPWIGCTKVSPGCDGCYAERSTPSRTMQIVWGAGQQRHRTSEGNWAMPLRWNREAAEFEREHGRRRRVFCASLADVFDNEVPTTWRMDLFSLIADTPNLDWLILTKRIGNVMRMCSGDSLMFDMICNRVWLGATVVNQEEADRDIPKLDRTPAAVRWLSMEPLLGPVDIGWERLWGTGGSNGIDWVVAGGESGPEARPMHPGWVRSLRDQCGYAGVPFLFKQWGEWLPAGKEPNEVQRLTLQFARPTARCYSWADGETLVHAGKKAAGRSLDGALHDGYPT